MPMRALLRGLIRAAAGTVVIVAATALPYTITVEWDQPVTPLPPAATALFIASSAMLAGAGWLHRRRDRLAVGSIASHS